MLHKYLEIASTPSVKAARERWGSAAQYARLDGSSGPDETVVHHRLTDQEAAFIAARDGFYVASVSETGWPYVQFRGGPPGFLRVLGEGTLGFADFRGNRQHITNGNVSANDCVSLFLMDYANRRRLKIFGRLALADASEVPELAERLVVPGYRARVERVALVHVAAFDWNCPQHITPRFSEAELGPALEPLRQELAGLRAENAQLRAERDVPTPPSRA